MSLGRGSVTVPYDGFISYSHAADGRFAPALQRGLQQLAKRWHSRRALRVFRDETGLSTNPHLWLAIEAGLDASAWFVLLASPEAAESPWVNKEVVHWLATKPVERILPVVTDGTWEWDRDAGDFTASSTAVPPALRGALRDEPRHLDVRWARAETDLDLRNSRFRGAVADLAAPMHGVAKDELEGEDIRQHRRARRLAGAGVIVVVVLLIVSVVFGALAVVQRNRANQNARAARREAAAADAARQVSDAARWAAQARSLASTQVAVGLLLAVQARHIGGDSPSTNATLEAVLSHVPQGQDRQVSTPSVGFCKDMSPNAELIAAGTSDGAVQLINTTSGQPVRTLRGNIPYTSCDFSPDGSVLVGTGPATVVVWDAATGRQIGVALHTSPTMIPAGFTSGPHRIVTYGIDDGTAVVWDTTDPSHPAPIGAPFTGTPEPPGVFPIPWTRPGDDRLAIPDGDQTVVWSIASHTMLYPPLPGKLILGKGSPGVLPTWSGGQIRLWDITTGHQQGPALSGFGPVSRVVFNPDGTRMAVNDFSNGVITVLDVLTHQLIGTIKTSSPIMTYLADGRLSIANGKTVTLQSVVGTGPAPFATPLAGAPTGGQAFFTAGGTKVYTTTSEGRLLSWDPTTGAPLGDLGGTPLSDARQWLGRGVSDSSVNADGTLIALDQPGGTIELWDLAHHRRAALVATGQREPLASWDPSAPILATTGLGGTLVLWNVADPTNPVPLVRTNAEGFSATAEPYAHFSPDGRALALVLATNPGTLQVLSLIAVPSGQTVRTLRITGDTTFGSDAAFSPDSKTLATPVYNGGVVLWGHHDRRATRCLARSRALRRRLRVRRHPVGRHGGRLQRTGHLAGRPLGHCHAAALRRPRCLRRRCRADHRSRPARRAALRWREQWLGRLGAGVGPRSRPLGSHRLPARRPQSRQRRVDAVLPGPALPGHLSAMAGRRLTKATSRANHTSCHEGRRAEKSRSRAASQNARQQVFRRASPTAGSGALPAPSNPVRSQL
jgi:WD40 repeat protein